jgi:superfamily II DNA/RNA helicase
MDDCLISPVENIKLNDAQLRAAKFLLKNRGLITAYGTGTGKTLTAVAIINCFLKNNTKGKIIFISPLSLKANLVKELKKFNLDARKEPLKSRLELHSFSSFQKKMESTTPINCYESLFIVDEAHTLRTPIDIKGSSESLDFKAGWIAFDALGCAARAKKVLLLTATPVYNSPTDILNLLAMVDGKEFPISYELFKKKKEDYFRSNEFKNMVKCRISFYSIENSKDYPRKEEYIQELFMDSDYYKKYVDLELEVFNDKYLESFGDPEKYAVFYHAFRRAVNDIDDNLKSPKVEWLTEELEKEAKLGNKSVVFSNWINSGIGLVIRKLKDKNIKFGFISGDVDEKTREVIKLAYNDNKISVLFISSAGGEGLDLTETSNVYIMESNWNVNRELQVIGRAVRYKSHANLPPEKQIVKIYRLILKKPKESDDEKGSIDEVLYNYSHKSKQPLLDVVSDSMKTVAIESQNCSTVPSNQAYYGENRITYEQVRLNKVLKMKERKDEHKILKKQVEKKDEEDMSIYELQESIREEINLKKELKKKELTESFNRPFNVISKLKKQEDRREQKLKEAQEEKEEKKDEEKKEEKKDEEEKKKEVDPTSKCYKLLVNNYVWSTDKDQFINNYKEYSRFLDSIPKTDARYNDKVLQIQVLKDCEEDLKNLDNFYRKIKSRYSEEYLPKELVSDVNKVLDAGYKNNEFNFEGRTIYDNNTDFIKTINQYYLKRSSIQKADLYSFFAVRNWFEQNMLVYMEIKKKKEEERLKEQEKLKSFLKKREFRKVEDEEKRQEEARKRAAEIKRLRDIFKEPDEKPSEMPYEKRSYERKIRDDQEEEEDEEDKERLRKIRERSKKKKTEEEKKEDIREKFKKEKERQEQEEEEEEKEKFKKEKKRRKQEEEEEKEKFKKEKKRRKQEEEEEKEKIKEKFRKEKERREQKEEEEEKEKIKEKFRKEKKKRADDILVKKVEEILDDMFNKGEIDLERDTKKSLYNKILPKLEDSEIDEILIKKMIQSWAVDKNKEIEEQKEEEDKEIEEEVIGKAVIEKEIEKESCEIFNIVLTFSYYLFYAYQTNTKAMNIDINDFIKYIKKIEEFKDCNDDDIEIIVDSIKVYIGNAEEENDEENISDEFINALKLFFSLLANKMAIMPFILTEEDFNNEMRKLFDDALINNKEIMSDIYDKLANDLLQYSLLINEAMYLYSDPKLLDDEEFEKNMMENLEDLYTSVDKELLEKEIEDSKQLFLYSEDLEDLTTSKIYTLISYLFYSGEVNSREYMDKYLNTIFENQDQENIATLIDKFEKISGISIPRNEQDRLEIEQEKKTMKEQKLRDKAFKREEVIKKWQEMIESKEDKEKTQKITTVVCKDYDLAYLLGGLFLYSYINEIKLDKVQNDKLLKFMLTLEDFKDCNEQSLLNNIIFSKDMLTNIVNEQEDHMIAAKALEIFLSYLWNNYKYQYNINFLKSSEFTNIVSLFISNPLLKNKNKIKEIQKALITNLFFYYLTNDIIEIIKNHNEYVFENDELDDVKDLIIKDLMEIRNYNEVSDKDAVNKFSSEVKRLVKMFISSDLDSILNREVLNIIKNLNTKDQEEILDELKQIFLSQSSDNLQSVMNMYLTSLEGEKISKPSCDADVVTIGAQIMNLIYEQKLNIEYIDNQALLEKLKKRYTESESCTDEELLDLILKAKQLLNISTYNQYTSHLESLNNISYMAHGLYKTFDKIDSLNILFNRVSIIFPRMSDKEVYFTTKSITAKIPTLKNLTLYSYLDDLLYNSRDLVFINMMSNIVDYKIQEFSMEEDNNIMLFSNKKVDKISRVVVKPIDLLKMLTFSSDFPQYLTVLSYNKDTEVCEIEEISSEEWATLDSIELSNSEMNEFKFIILLVLLTCYENNLFITFSRLKNLIFIKKTNTQHTFKVCGSNYKFKSNLDIRIVPIYWGVELVSPLCEYTYMDSYYLSTVLNVNMTKEDNIYMSMVRAVDMIKPNINNLETKSIECKDNSIYDFTNDIVTRFSPKDNEISKLRDLIDERSVPLMFSYFCVNNMNSVFFKNLIALYLILGKKAPHYVSHNIKKSLYYRLLSVFSGIIHETSKDLELTVPYILSSTTKNRTLISKVQARITTFRKTIANKAIITGYYPPASFIQIKLVKDNPRFVDLVVDIVSKSITVNKQQTESFVKDLITNYTNDLVFYEELKEFVSKYFKKNTEEEIDLIRANAKWRDISFIFKNLPSNMKLLDYGGGNGAILSLFSARLNLFKENAISVDVETWVGTTHDKPYKNITYKTIKPGSEIGVSNNSLDVILAFQVLHHLPYDELKLRLKEFYNLLKKGGILVVREHDCSIENTEETNYVRTFIDIEHTLYETVVNDQPKMNGEQLCVYDDGEKYKSIREWDKTLESYGFKTLSGKMYESRIKGETRYTYRYYTK